jgi:hypothetical protein
LRRNRDWPFFTDRGVKAEDGRRSKGGGSIGIKI